MDLLKKNKKYGFTLIELIVVIAIIGIILILALPQVSKIQEANRDRKFEVYKESIVRGAKLYIDSNAKDLFGNNNSGCITLKYSDLENRSLVKDFASDTITCSDDAETYVEVRKVNKNYKYAVSIVCRENEDIVYEDRIDDTFACENKPDTEAPLVTITPEKYNWTQSKNIKVKIKVEDPSGLNRNTGIKYYWTDSSGKKVGKTYQYNYKNKKGTSKVSYQIPEKNVPTASGQYKLVVEPWSSSTTSGIQDALGNVSLLSKEAGLYKIDNVKPTCGKAEGEKKNWTNQNFRINQECKDDASGCVQNPYSKEFTKTTTTHTFTIKDNAGNSRTCTVDVYLDKSKPNVPTSKIRKDNSKGAVQTNQNKWTSNTLWWGEFKSTGSTSPIDHFEYSENCTGTKSGNLSSSYTYNKDKNSTYCIRAVNEAGTASNWSGKYYFKIDKTAPSLSGNITSRDNRFQSKNVYINLTASDNVTTAANLDMYISNTGYEKGGSWTSYKSQSNWTLPGSYDGSTKYVYVTVRDEVGHKTNKRLSYKVYKNCTTKVDNGGWYNKGACSVTCGGGTLKQEKKQKDAYTGASCGVVTQNVACNTQSCKPTKPTINLHGYSSGSWTNQNVTITMSSTSTVGIDHYEYSHDLVKWQRDYDYDSVHWQQSFNSDRSSMTVTISWNGDWNFHVRAVDKQGNVSDVADAFNIKIDKTKPTLTGTFINMNSGTAYQSGTWTYEKVIRQLFPNDSGGSGFKEVQYNDDNGGWHTEKYYGYWELGEMNRHSRYRAVDNAGNVSDEISMHFMINLSCSEANPYGCPVYYACISAGPDSFISGWTDLHQNPTFTVNSENLSIQMASGSKVYKLGDAKSSGGTDMYYVYVDDGVSFIGDRYWQQFFPGRRTGYMRTTCLRTSPPSSSNYCTRDECPG